MSLFDDLPDTIEILDLLEFCWRHIGDPIQGSSHSYFSHVHLSFNRPLGQNKFCQQINSIFNRNQLAYTLTGEGRIERLGPPVLREELASAEFVTGQSRIGPYLGVCPPQISESRRGNSA